MKFGYDARKIFVGGIQGSGKTHLARHLARTRYKKSVGIRFTPDFDSVDGMVLIQPGPDPRATVERVAGELCKIGRDVMEGRRAAHEYDAFFVDEADMIFRGNYDIGPNFGELMLMHRHYKIALILMTRRPQDIPAKYIESCHYLFIFKLEGKNVMTHLASIHPQIPQMVNQLDYARHNFVFKELGETPIIHRPIDSKI